MHALIVVDVQNDFLPGGSLAVSRSNEVIPIVRNMMEKFDLVFATQDWHPPGHKSFASSHEGRTAGEQIELRGQPQVLWPDHCVQGTPGAEFSADLPVDQITQIVQKGTHPEVDSYSGFFDNDRQSATGLEEVLKSHGVQHCYVLGLATDYCVKFTALDALKCGFQTTIIKDGCRGVNRNPDDESDAFAEMEQAGCQLVLSGAVDI